MQTHPVLTETSLPFPLFCRGKVRDTYEVDGGLLIISTDRISAFDVVLPNGIPEKGMVLNKLSTFWFQATSHIVPNHFIEAIYDVRLLNPYIPKHTCYVFPKYLAGRSMLVRQAQRIPVECVVRGYISGSAWKEYCQQGTAGGILLPAGLRESERLPQPIFTPTTKEESGHDMPLTFDELVNLSGSEIAYTLRNISINLYNYAHSFALNKGIIVADTKFEFGILGDRIILIDELLTPDSSRFWDGEKFEPGKSQPSFDKQPVRDWLVESGWNMSPPAPALPPDVVKKTTEKYVEVFCRLTGKSLDEDV